MIYLVICLQLALLFAVMRVRIHRETRHVHRRRRHLNGTIYGSMATPAHGSAYVDRPS